MAGQQEPRDDFARLRDEHRNLTRRIMTVLGTVDRAFSTAKKERLSASGDPRAASARFLAAADDLENSSGEPGLSLPQHLYRLGFDEVAVLVEELVVSARGGNWKGVALAQELRRRLSRPRRPRRTAEDWTACDGAAAALAERYPHMTKTEICERVNIRRGDLDRFPDRFPLFRVQLQGRELAAADRALRSVRGTKDKAGNLEAWDGDNRTT